MTAFELGSIALVLGLGVVLQTAVGFGMALFSVPLLVLAGHPLPRAVALVLGAALVQTAFGSYATRAHIRWSRALAFATMQWLALAGGVVCMGLLMRSDPARIKQVVGLLLLVAVSLQPILNPTPRERLAAIWTPVAAAASGFSAGLAGMGGPPLVLYALAHSWSPDRIRAFLWSQFLLAIPVTATLLSLRFGPHLLSWFALGAAMAPITWAGTRLGRKASDRWDRRRLQLVASLVLYTIALSNLVAPWLRGSGS